MRPIDESLEESPLITLSAGECLLNQNEKTNSLYILKKGKVRVIKDGYDVALTSENGTVFGEMSIMLDIEHSATVQCVEDSVFYHIENPKEYLESNPEFIWHIAQILSRRLNNLNQYLVDLKSQSEVFGEKKMVDREKMLNDVLSILQIS